MLSPLCSICEILELMDNPLGTTDEHPFSPSVGLSYCYRYVDMNHHHQQYYLQCVVQLIQVTCRELTNRPAVVLMVGDNLTTHGCLYNFYTLLFLAYKDTSQTGKKYCCYWGLTLMHIRWNVGDLKYDITSYHSPAVCMVLESTSE